MHRVGFLGLAGSTDSLVIIIIPNIFYFSADSAASTMRAVKVVISDDVFYSVGLHSIQVLTWRHIGRLSHPLLLLFSIRVILLNFLTVWNNVKLPDPFLLLDDGLATRSS